MMKMIKSLLIKSHQSSWSCLRNVLSFKNELLRNQIYMLIESFVIKNYSKKNAKTHATKGKYTKSQQGSTQQNIIKFRIGDIINV